MIHAQTYTALLCLKTEPSPVGHTPIGPHQLESRVRGNRSHGSQGRVANSGHPYPYRGGRSVCGRFCPSPA